MKQANGLAGKGELAYRAGTYRSFFADMVRAARRKPPLARLNTDAEGDFTNVLLSAWARVCDVLTFYQERIANEGYLPTATESESVLHLAASIGEHRKPALGAQTQLALQLIDAGGQPRHLRIDPPQSLVVQNTPRHGDPPVIFECAERIELRPAWNALAPVIPRVSTPAALWAGCRSLRLVGTSLGIRPGGALLLTADDGAAWLVIVDTVQVDRTLGCTLITWRSPAEGSGTIATVTQFKRSAGLFGRTAMAWEDVPDKQKQAIGVRAGGVMTLDQRGLTPDPRMPGPDLWARPANAQPPPANIQSLLGLDGDGLLAGTDRGVFRSTDRGVTWQALTLPQPQGWHDVLSLHRDQAGTLYAGTESGLVLSSVDGGDSWAMMTQTVLPDTGEKQGAFLNILEDLHIRERPKAPEKWTITSPIRSIASQTDPGALSSIYIGTDEGVFAMTGDVAPWKPFSNALPGFDQASSTADISVFALAVVDGAFLVAATNRGAFWTGPGAVQWASMSLDPLGAECTSLATNTGIVFIGTSGGVKSFLHNFNEGKDYFEPYQVWPSPRVNALAGTADTLYAATAGGIQFLTEVNGESWLYSEDWDSLDIQDLTLFEMDSVFADGLDAGQVSTELSQRFARFGIELDTDVEVRPIFLRISSQGVKAGWELREGPPSARIFRIYAETPLRVTQLVQNQTGSGDRLAATAFGLVASLPLGPVINQEWPDFAIATGDVTGDVGVDGAEIYLDRKIDGIEDGSWLVLAPAGSSLTAQPEVHAVIASEAILHKAYGRQGTVSRIVVEPTAALLAADPRTTNAYLISGPLAPFTATNADLKPLAGATLTLPGVHGDLAPGRSLQVSGPRPGAFILRRTQTSQIVVDKTPLARAGAEAAPALDQQMIAPDLKDAFTAAGIKLSPSAAVTVVAAGAIWLVRDGDQAWRLDLPAASDDALPLGIFATTLYEVIARPRDGSREWTLAYDEHAPHILADEDEILWQGARSVQKSFSEIATIKSVAFHLESNATAITLTAPLHRAYDAAQCRICANVALATQGETVPHEVLGSGQLGQPHQTFRLLRAPLTYTRDLDGLGVRNELRVQVNGYAGRGHQYGGGSATAGPQGEPWVEVDALALAGPAERVFSVSTDAAGRAILRFGDGIHGARLPSGRENVTASYRNGAGAQGNVPAGSLIALKKRPAGIRSATNPVAATGGTDAEAIDALRDRAPRKLRHFDRIVTLSDYEAFAKDFAGIGKAQAVLIGTEGEARLISLTVATESGLPISQAPALREALAASIEARRADRLQLRLADFVAVPFDVTLSIIAQADVDPALVAKEVRAALATEFGFARRDFGDGVNPHHVSETVRQVPGVRSAMLLALHRTGAPQAGIAQLVAEKPRRDAGGAFLPAELLLVNAAAPTGIGIGIVVGT